MKTRFTTPLQARRGDPRGQVLVLFALMLVVLLLVSALAVDYGGWLVAKRNYQNVGDAAALAGAQQLTRPLAAACTGGQTKNFCARQAAWESVKSALGFSGLNPIAQAGVNTPYVDGSGFKVWVASPPSDAGAAYLGHVSGPGNVYVRIEHPGQTFLSNIAGLSRTVTAWSTAGRFPANFAVIAMCSPISVTANCLAGDANIKLDGSGTNLIVNTGDLGTNRWTKTGGNTSGVALGADSNAYMQLFDTCWANASNQCQLWGYNSPNIDYTTTRSAIPLGAPIPNPSYPAPTVSSATVPWQCYPTSPPAVQLASVQVLERNTPDPVADLPIELAAAIVPADGKPVVNATNYTVSGLVKSLVGSTLLNGIVVTSSPGNGNSTTVAGAYSMALKDSTTYTLTATDNSGVYHTTTATANVGNANLAMPDILMPKNPVVSGTVTSSSTGLPLNNVLITITVQGVDYTTNTDATGFYQKTIPVAGVTFAYTIAGTLTGYTTGGTSVFAPTAYDTNYPNKNFTLTPAPATITGTVKDAVTTLPIPYVRVTLSTGQTADTDLTGTYTFPSATVSPSVTFTLGGSATDSTALDGYLPGDSLSSHPTPYTTAVNAGANSGSAFNFSVWPRGCKDTNAVRGDWSCAFPSGSNCPATTNPDAANVTCTFTRANAIRPGTYHDITLPNNTCAWLDPKGGATGLKSGQSAGIYHITGTISLGNNSYLFGDGVTIVMNQGSNLDVNNGGGFVLNYGTHKVSGTGACDPNTDFATPYAYGDTGNKCFRTVALSGTQDYAYAAWTTKGHVPWTAGTFPTYDDSVVQKGQELGITFYMYGAGLGNASRMKLATANMGYLFNGVLYAPNDDIQLGGGKDGQSAAGQIVGWTIEYHGGTRILQNWYGDPVDGEPFLIEPILGE